jgi:carbamoyl-phosphate synthase large subunit
MLKNIMAKNRSIKKVLVVGSGPVIIGQAAEFDYAGTQACLELRKEGVEVILINSNPATIMTDKQVADKIYIEPLNAETIKKICLKETPDSVLSNMGGQVGLNLCCELADEGFFRKQKINVIGSKPETIKITEDRLLFKNAMKQINEPCIESDVAINMDGALKIGKKIGLPLIIRPAFTLGGTGGGIAKTWSEFEKIAENGLNVSKIHQILVEKSVAG